MKAFYRTLKDFINSVYRSINNQIGAFRDFFSQNFFEIAFTALLSLMPYRLMSILHIDQDIKLIVGLTLFIGLIYFRKTIIPLFFSSVVYQLLIYSIMLVENFFLTRPLIFFNFLLLWAFLVQDYLSLSDFILFLVYLSFLRSFYARAQYIFLNLDNYDEEVIEKNNIGLCKPEDLTWDYVAKMMSFRVEKLYGRPVPNTLPTQLGQTSFPYLVKRNMIRFPFRHILDQMYDSQQKLTWFLGGLGALFSGAVLLKKTNAEAEKDLSEARKNNAEAEMARAKARKFNAEAKVAEAQEHQVRSQTKIITNKAEWELEIMKEKAAAEELRKKSAWYRRLSDYGSEFELVQSVFFI